MMRYDIDMDDVGDIPTLDTHLLTTLQKLKSESWLNDLDIWSYLSLQANYEMAAAFTKLFWPDFIEVDGCVFLEHQYSPESFAEWMSQFNGDKQAVEAVINHVHIWDLFVNSPIGESQHQQLFVYLAKAFIFGWKQALQGRFPEKHFVFTLAEGYGVEVSFHQIAPSL